MRIQDNDIVRDMTVEEVEALAAARAEASADEALDIILGGADA